MLREELRHNAVRIRKLESELAKRFDEVLRSPYLDSNEIVRRSSVYQCPSRQIVKFERLDRYLDRLKKKSPSFHQHPFPVENCPAFLPCRRMFELDLGQVYVSVPRLGKNWIDRLLRFLVS